MLVLQDKEDRGSVSSILLSSFFNANSTSAGIAGIMTDAHQFAVVLVETLFNPIEEVCLVKFEEPTDDIRAKVSQLYHARQLRINKKWCFDDMID